MRKLEAVVLYSSNDKRFFKACIENLLKCNIKVHVITYSHMWAGEKEDMHILEQSNHLFANEQNYGQYQIDWTPGQSSWYWEGLGRYLGTTQVSADSDYTLYIDVDEIVDPDGFVRWMSNDTYYNYDAMKLPNYWYWRKPEYRATVLQYNTVMLKTSIAKQLPLASGGREIYFNASSNQYMVPEEFACVHHYSWVRTREEMRNKVGNWGHNSDRSDWIAKVEDEFSREFNGTDFLNGYSYNVVENIFNV
jgi:hypothetical protein